MSALVAVLAAGRATRFGADKLSQPCAGRPLGAWALAAALATDRPVAWIAGDTPPAFVGGQCKVLRNLHAAEGQATSVATAATAAAEGGYAALLILLADMPLVDAAMLEALIDRGAPAAYRHADGRPGVPALLPASVFPALRALSGDRGAGPVLGSLPGLALLDCEPQRLLDVDTPADLAEAERCLRDRG